MVAGEDEVVRIQSLGDFLVEARKWEGRWRVDDGVWV